MSWYIQLHYYRFQSHVKSAHICSQLRDRRELGIFVLVAQQYTL
uniref:Uncharacterized protein n=1 Tax=Arundo donax TaxID=35708 RepID=A0A0A9DVW1_ARUDO